MLGRTMNGEALNHMKGQRQMKELWVVGWCLVGWCLVVFSLFVLVNLSLVGVEQGSSTKNTTPTFITWEDLLVRRHTG